MVRTFAAELIEQHGGDAFNRDPQLKSRLAAMLQRCLPPRRKPGRPGFATVTAAIGLHTELKRSSPESSPKEIWKEIYRRLIPRGTTYAGSSAGRKPTTSVSACSGACMRKGESIEKLAPENPPPDFLAC